MKFEQFVISQKKKICQKFFKKLRPLLGPFLNTLSHITPSCHGEYEGITVVTALFNS